MEAVGVSSARVLTGPWSFLEQAIQAGGDVGPPRLTGRVDGRCGPPDRRRTLRNLDHVHGNQVGAN